ncbi:hypothetical protein V8C42DRAFT_328461 [Trichoderma barbatum]
MDVLPSYQQATTRPDWLQLAAPFIAFTDYPSLCRVSRRFWLVFAPRLWRDPCAASKRLGWSTDHDTRRWWTKFMFQKLGQLTLRTRCLVRVLDARGAAGPREFAMYPELTGDAFGRAISLLPDVEALFLDDHVGVNVRFLGSGPLLPLGRTLRMLSLVNCTYGVAPTLISPHNLPELVYLDMSGTGLPIPHQTLELPLPRLRILKLRRNGIRVGEQYFNVLDRRLWSLDLSDNKLSDCAIPSLLSLIDPGRQLRTSQYEATEGVVQPWMDFGIYPPIMCLQEGQHSTDFVPGERYQIDAPPFDALSNGEQDAATSVRSDGSVSIRPDTLEGVLYLLSLDDGVAATDHLPGSIGITHLHLSGNEFSATAIESLLCSSNGQIEHFDCDGVRLYPPAQHFGCDSASCREFYHSNPNICTSSSIKMYGFSGLSQIFRPAWCSNLRSLRIHHSFVTNIPTLKIPGYGAIECMHLAEKQLLPGLDWAYSLGFLPGMNPRLQSLTLTCVPRHSFGPLVRRLTFFLRLLGLQEHTISTMNKAEASNPGRPVRMVSGLRHLTLEMELEPRELISPLELDAEELMASGDVPFSFFYSPDEKPPPKMPHILHIWSQVNPKAPILPPDEIGHDIAAHYSPAVLPGHAQRDLSKEKWIRYRETLVSPFVAVWAGNTWSTSPVIKMYCQLVLEHGVYDDLGPVTIHHTRAGAPAGCLIFRKTWLFAALPQSLEMPPIAPPPAFEDVAAELQRRRVSTREEFERVRQLSPDRPCFCWGGKLDIIDTRPK